jgi:signal transduction histidine kinase
MKNDHFVHIRNLKLILISLFSIFAIYVSPISKAVFPPHLFLHTAIELLCVAISFTLFIMQIGTLERNQNTRTIILASTFFAVAFFDLLHTMSFKGMPDFVTKSSTDKAIYFWLLARGVLAFSFFSMAIMPTLSVSKSTLYKVFSLTTMVIIVPTIYVLFYQETLPRMFIEGYGLTTDKIIIEFIILGLATISGVILYSKKGDSFVGNKNLILAKAALLMATSEICFTIYLQHNDVFNFWGHVLKLFSFAYIYVALIKMNLLQPYRQIDAIKSELGLKIENIRALQEELDRSRKVVSLGSEVRGIAHDLNNVLMIVLNSATLLLKHNNNSADEQVVKRVDQIRNAVAKSQGFLKSLINFSKNGSNEKEVLDVQNLFVEFSKLLRPLIPSSVQLKFSCETNLDLCIARTELEQLIFNLVLNARDAIGEIDGTILIDAHHTHLSFSKKFLHYHIPVGEYVCISITDSGSGIKAENLDKIFDPFFTTKAPGKGTGVGLATVVSIMQKNHGYVTVDSIMGRGTTFTLYFLKSSIVLNGETDLDVA